MMANRTHTRLYLGVMSHEAMEFYRSVDANLSIYCRIIWFATIRARAADIIAAEMDYTESRRSRKSLILFRLNSKIYKDILGTEVVSSAFRIIDKLVD